MTISTAGCAVKRPEPPRVEVVRVTMPPELLAPITLPPLPADATWGDLAAYLASEVPAVVAECNARLETIGKLASQGSRPDGDK